MPAITPDGQFVVYVRTNDMSIPDSLWVRQIGTTREVQIVAPDPSILVLVMTPTVSPDGRFVDFIKTSPATGRELWRVPLLGGAQHRLRTNVSSPIGWSPDGKHGAFVAYGNDFLTSSLVEMSESAPDRVLATRAAPANFVSLNVVGEPPARPAWSPGSRLVALPEIEDLLAPRIAFVDAVTGEETSIDSQGSFVPQGLGWLGPETLVLSQPEAFGQRIQLWRMSYPDGKIAPLTNDLASYIGVDLDASRTRLVTTRRDVRTSIWLADSSGSTATQLVPPTPFGTARVLLSWAGDRLFYDSTFGGRAAIMAIAPDGGTPEQIVPDAFYVAAAPDGSAIVYSSATRGQEGLWRTDASGQRPVQLVKGFVVEPVVTPDRRVVYLSTRGGAVSPWSVPLDGGEPTEIAGESVVSMDVSPDGRRLAYSLPSLPQGQFVVCDLPDCSNRLELRGPRCLVTAVRFTPDAKALACAGLTSQNIYAVPLDGSAPYALTSFDPDPSKIVRFAWSHDGRLALARTTTATDVVLLSGLHP